VCTCTRTGYVTILYVVQYCSYGHGHKITLRTYKTEQNQSPLSLVALFQFVDKSLDTKAHTPTKIKTKSYPFLLFRKHTALPGLMFDRPPTRHPSLDDLRGYGRRAAAAGGRGRGRQPARDDVNAGDDAYDRAEAAAALKLPPIRTSSNDAAAVSVDSSRCLHPQSRVCRNLRYNLHQLKIRSQDELYRALVAAVVVRSSPFF